MNTRLTAVGALLAAAITTGIAGSASAQDTLRVGTEGAYPPWNFTEADGTLAGFEIDLANAICDYLEMTCEFVAQDWDGIIPALQQGRYDVIMAGMSITEERKESINFSYGYMVTPASFATLSDSPLAGLESLEEVIEALDGTVVGVQGATIHENFLRQELGDQIDIRVYDTQDNLNLDLVSGRIDAGLADMNAWVDFQETPEGGDVVTIGPGLTGNDFPIFGEGVGIGLRKDDEELLAHLNEAICALYEDGTTIALTEEWFGFDAALPCPE